MLFDRKDDGSEGFLRFRLVTSFINFHVVFKSLLANSNFLS
jgi:hypothetical protein